MFQIITVAVAILVGLAMGGNPPGCDMNSPAGQEGCLTNFAGLWRAVKQANEGSPRYVRITVHDHGCFDLVADNGLQFRKVHLGEKKTFPIPAIKATVEAVYTLKGPRELNRVGRTYDLPADVQKALKATELKTNGRIIVSDDGKQLTEIIEYDGGKLESVYERIADGDEGGKNV